MGSAQSPTVGGALGQVFHPHLGSGTVQESVQSGLIRCDALNSDQMVRAEDCRKAEDELARVQTGDGKLKLVNPMVVNRQYSVTWFAGKKGSVITDNAGGADNDGSQIKDTPDVQINRFMSAKLEGVGFDITPSDYVPLNVARNLDIRQSWQVIPRSEGKRELILRLKNQVVIDGKRMDIDTPAKVYTVNVSPVPMTLSNWQDFIINNLKWLALLLATITGVVVAWKKLRRTVSGSAAEPEANNSAA
ncbi:MAG: hypothetical protein HC843_02625 [Sphingomonadales bacterium]|nr:hypothetical protein [Sphingomonadales bacterium]